MSDEGRLVANRYRIIERIGSGAMGAVWQAQDEILHRDVAIKQLLLQPGLDENEAEDARRRTMREGRIAARLHHPNAISVFDVVTDEHGQPCLIMEYLASTSLAALLQAEKTLAPLEVARVGAQIASALQAAHEVDVVHRDIKPGNVLLADNGTVKLTDFGISRAKDDVTVTKTGMIAGTPAYLAPEVAVGGEPGPESDVFALGSTLYAATEGQPPFGLSENTLGLLHAVAAGQINPPRQSGPLASVLAVMLHPEIKHRPTAEESRELLAAVARGETPLGGGVDRNNTAASAGAAGAAAASGAALGYDDFERRHSGTLTDEMGAGFPAQVEDPYQPVDGYPDEDYDATQAVAMGGTSYTEPFEHDPYWDYDDGYYDGYYDDADGGPPTEFAAPMADEDERRRGKWKIPAAIGAITVIGLAALAFWIFGPQGTEEKQQAPVVAPATTTTTTSSSSQTTTTTTTTTVVRQPTQDSDRGSRQTDTYVQPPVQDTTTTTPPPQQPSSTTTSEPTNSTSSQETSTSTNTDSNESPAP